MLGAIVLMEALDPFATYLSWQWNTEWKRYELLWTEQGTLKQEDWENVENAVSPHPVAGDSKTSEYWKLDF